MHYFNHAFISGITVYTLPHTSNIYRSWSFFKCKVSQILVIIIVQIGRYELTGRTGICPILEQFWQPKIWSTEVLSLMGQDGSRRSMGYLVDLQFCNCPPSLLKNHQLWVWVLYSNWILWVLKSHPYIQVYSAILWSGDKCTNKWSSLVAELQDQQMLWTFSRGKNSNNVILLKALAKLSSYVDAGNFDKINIVEVL